MVQVNWSFAVQYAKIKGASKIIAVDVWEEKLEMAKKNGADVVINSMKEDAAAKVMEATGGNGADIVIDYSGAPICQKAAINSAAKLGKVVFLGISHQGLELSEKEVDKIYEENFPLKVPGIPLESHFQEVTGQVPLIYTKITE